MSEVTAPVWNSAPAIENAINQYRMQLNQAITGIQNLDQQRAQLVKTTDSLVGAIAALEQLVQNGKDEAEAIKAAEVARAEQRAAEAAVLLGRDDAANKDALADFEPTPTQG